MPELVTGIYRQYDARMKQTPPPRYIGHVQLHLPDGRRVFVEPPWSKEAIRPPEERARCDGKRVSITCDELSQHMPSPPQAMAHPTGACLIGVSVVALLEA